MAARILEDIFQALIGRVMWYSANQNNKKISKSAAARQVFGPGWVRVSVSVRVRVRFRVRVGGWVGCTPVP